MISGENECKITRIHPIKLIYKQNNIGYMYGILNSVKLINGPAQ